MHQAIMHATTPRFCPDNLYMKRKQMHNKQHSQKTSEGERVKEGRKKLASTCIPNICDVWKTRIRLQRYLIAVFFSVILMFNSAE